MPSIHCWNEWNDYTGGPDHLNLEEAGRCQDEDGRPHVVIMSMDEYMEYARSVTPALHVGPIKVPLDETLLEDVVIGALKQLRNIDETKMRRAWQSTEGHSLEMRLAYLLGSNGPEYHVVLNTVRALDADA